MPKIALSIVSGFLGSGKTTFLSEVLQKIQRKNIALIVNEIGQSTLDDSILASFFVQEKTVLLNKGCLCCNKREDLILSLKELLNNYHKDNKTLEHIIIETTGLATVEPILFTVLSDVFLQNHFYINAVFTCVDVLNALSYVNENEESISQIISSDCLILTKTDLKSDVDEISKSLRALNPSAKIIKKSDFIAEKLLSFNRKKSPTKHLEKRHNVDINTISVELEGEIEWSAFGIWLSMLLQKYGDRILRVKGVINTKDFLIAINGVRHIMYPPQHIKKLDKEYKSNLVFISKNLDLNKVLSSLKAFSSLLKARIV